MPSTFIFRCLSAAGRAPRLKLTLDPRRSIGRCPYLGHSCKQSMCLHRVLLKQLSFLHTSRKPKSGGHRAEPTFCSNTRKMLRIGKQTQLCIFSTWIESKSRGHLGTSMKGWLIIPAASGLLSEMELPSAQQRWLRWPCSGKATKNDWFQNKRTPATKGKLR